MPGAALVAIGGNPCFIDDGAAARRNSAPR
jgi:hypothetical protein